MDTELQLEEKRFVEEVSIAFEQMNMPRMAGRIVGRLMISDPPYQSTDALAEALMASRGSISTMSRFLIQFNLIERFSLPGVRQDYFRVKPDAWHQLVRQRTHQITTLRRLAEHGLRLMGDREHANRLWLEETRDMYAFFEREFPALVERWEEEHKLAGYP